MSRHFEAFKKIIEEHPMQRIVLATYLRKEFEAIRPGEDYDAFKRMERSFIEELAQHGFQNCVVFQQIDPEGYRQYRSQNKLPDGEAARAAYAAYKYDMEHK